jgi:hypothetical protein
MDRFALRLALPLLLVAAATAPARADEAGPDRGLPIVPLAATPPARVWYGWQVLAADGAMLGLTAGCLATDSIDEDVCMLPLVGYLVTGPIVHGRHSGGKRLMASLALRAGLPILGALIGAASANCPPRDENEFLDLCGLSEMGLGVTIGMGVAVAIDGLWAFEDAAPTQPLPAPSRASWSVTPTVRVSDNSAGFGLAGRF